jgi:membrane protease YdiL (CAAX protease family)
MPANGAAERLAGIAAIPPLATLLYYALPGRWQASLFAQFLPQVLAYGCLVLWTWRNQDIMSRLGLDRRRLAEGARLGLAVGLCLGALNSSIILWVVPGLGIDIDFLKQTPHARAPSLFMLPWGIMAIAVGVELNFRGFLLGRLLACFHRWHDTSSRGSWASAVGISALAFSFDPFMVATFRDLHWIAVWDGIVWGMMWVRRRNLYATIVAHAVEVMVMYSVLKVVMAS